MFELTFEIFGVFLRKTFLFVKPMKNLLSALALITSLVLSGCATSSNKGRPEASLVVSSVRIPIQGEIIATGGSSENEADRVPILKLHLKAEGDHVLVHDIPVRIDADRPNKAVVSTVYLYDGDTVLAASSVDNGKAIFNDVDVIVHRRSPKTLTVKADIRNAVVSLTMLSATVPPQLVATDILEKPIVVYGSAMSDTVYVRNAGPSLELAAPPTITVNRSEHGGRSVAVVNARFYVRMTAKGRDILVGTQSAKDTFGFTIYENGVPKNLNVPASASFVIPTSDVLPANSQGFAFKLLEKREVVIPVDYTFVARVSDGKPLNGNYAVELSGVKFSVTPESLHTVNSMTGNPAWRTPQISLTVSFINSKRLLDGSLFFIFSI